MHEHVQLAKAEDGEPLKFAHIIGGHHAYSSMAFADNDQKLIMSRGFSGSGYVRVVNTADGSLVRETLVSEDWIVPMIVSPDGQTYAVSRMAGSSQVVTLYNVADGSFIREFDRTVDYQKTIKFWPFLPPGRYSPPATA